MWPFSKEWETARVSLPMGLAALAPILPVILSAGAGAQESDLTQTPNAIDAGIYKSLEEQIGAGWGDWSSRIPRAF
jgi:hypothetical protein